MWDEWRDDPRFHEMISELGYTVVYKLARETLARLVQEQEANTLTTLKQL